MSVLIALIWMFGIWVLLATTAIVLYFMGYAIGQGVAAGMRDERKDGNDTDS